MRRVSASLLVGDSGDAASAPRSRPRQPQSTHASPRRRPVDASKMGVDLSRIKRELAQAEAGARGDAIRR